MTKDQERMQEFHDHIRGCMKLQKELAGNMTDRQKQAWEKMIGKQLREIANNIDRIKKAASKRAPTLEEMFSL
jgi:hypothetical protein